MITVQSTNQYGFVVYTTHFWISTALFERDERIAQGHTNVSVNSPHAPDEDAP